MWRHPKINRSALLLLRSRSVKKHHIELSMIEASSILSHAFPRTTPLVLDQGDDSRNSVSLRCM